MLPAPDIPPHEGDRSYVPPKVMWMPMMRWPCYYLHEHRRHQTDTLAKVYFQDGRWNFSIKDERRAEAIRAACEQLVVHLTVERMRI